MSLTPARYCSEWYGGGARHTSELAGVEAERKASEPLSAFGKPVPVDNLDLQQFLDLQRKLTWRA